MDFSIGRVVCSAAGRDAGRRFVIVEQIDEQYVLVSDGTLRKLSNPKKKKIKHLKAQPEVLECIKEKLISGSKVFDSEIRNALESQNNKQDEE